MPHKPEKFRPDIEGLRSLAILPILFNHADVKGFAGGFVGVDIFFVISGYLITQILVRDTANGDYSIAGFYRRRILRLFPALFATLAAVTIVAILAMAPSELVSYAKSALATLLFASNLFFWGDTGYFAATAASRPLLHTWSLAVEEQFYIFWPLLIAAAARSGIGTIRVLIAVIVVASLIAAEWMVGRDMSTAFYLIPFRTWELGLGGMLAVMPGVTHLPRMIRELASAAGLLAILYCVHFFREPIVFPGLNALPACLGAVAIIACGPDTLTNRLLATAAPRFFGRISYSLYLWHWPVIVFARLWFFLPATAPVIAVEMLVSVLLGWLSYRFIENGGRDLLQKLPRARLLAGAVAAMIAAAIIPAALVAARGLPQRFSAMQNRLDNSLGRNDEALFRPGHCFMVEAGQSFDEKSCLERHGEKPSVLLIGDSLAAHYWPGLRIHAQREQVLQATMIGCRPMIYPDSDDRPCARFFTSILNGWAVKEHPTGILLSGRWMRSDLPRLDTTLGELKAHGLRPILIGPVPRYQSALPRLLFFGMGPDQASRAWTSYEDDLFAIDRDMRTMAARRGVPYISPIAMLCRDQHCQVYAQPGIPLQFDYAHLTVEGSDLLIGKSMPQIEAALGTAPISVAAR